jgi:hypothetical protein
MRGEYMPCSMHISFSCGLLPTRMRRVSTADSCSTTNRSHQRRATTLRRCSSYRELTS